MAIKVKNLKVDYQTGSDNTVFAEWEFNETSSATTASSSSLKTGDKVTIKSNAKWYNGSSISSWVFSKTWIVKQVSGTRVVIDKSTDGENSICSAIDTKYLTKSGSSSSTVVEKNTLDYYKVIWKYATGDGLWFEGTSTQTDYKHSTYNPPANATKVNARVKPVAKKYTDKKKNKQVSYWTGEAVSATFLMSHMPPEDLPVPTVEVNGFKLTASVTNISDSKTDQVQFYLYKGDSKYDSEIVTVKSTRASHTYSIAAGGKYRVKCRAINVIGDTKIYGEWSDFSEEKTTIPKACTDLKVKVQSDKIVKVTWTNADGGDNRYEIQYATDKNYFDRSTEVSSVTVDKGPGYITGLEEGRRWYFRIRAINDVGESAWSSIVSAIIGTKPDIPTTWSLTNSVLVGEKIKLYWTHNSEDGSNQQDAVVRIRYKLGDATEETIVNESWDGTTVPEDEEEPTYFYEIDTAAKKFKEGGYIRWAVKTKGIHADYSEYSTIRKIDVYDPPSLGLKVSTLDDDDVLKEFPIKVQMTAEPDTQTPLSYQVAIVAKQSYSTREEDGSIKYVSSGDVLYSKVFTPSKKWTYSVSIGAADMHLQSGRKYAVTATVAMNSGLTASASKTFKTSFVNYDYYPTANVSIDWNTLSAEIEPYCHNSENEAVLTDNVKLSVYRREYDGSFTEIDSDLVNDGNRKVTDPHPSLDYARYRIVATDINTSIMDYTDLPGVPVLEPSIVIQWDERFTEFDYEEDHDPADDPKLTSIVKLPGNVDTTEENEMDASLIEYIGRRHPVSYYGTQQGETATWNAEIPKTDVETIYDLRRLAKWRGDVYVREPSGVGYWARVKVSMSRKHGEMTIPVSFNITRVEGGK